MLKAKDLVNESAEELEIKLETLRKEIFQLRGQALSKKTPQTHVIGQKKKEIARIMTIKRQRELTA
jgi:large subunit ribosomal protein L29